MMNDEWWMMNDEWWMMNDEWWMMNDEWWMMNDEWITEVYFFSWYSSVSGMFSTSLEINLVENQTKVSGYI